MPDSTYPSSSLRLTAMLKDLARIRGFVEESAMICGISPTDLPGVLLAVDEAVTNIILYGYDGGSGPG